MIDRQSATRPILEALLSTREELIWIGQPPQGVRFYTEDWYWIPISFLFGLSFGSLGIYSLMAGDLPNTLIGIGIILCAFYIMVGRLLLDTYLRARTYYALTNRRIIIHSTALQRITTSYDLQTLGNLRVETKRTSQGTVYLNDLPHRQGIGVPGRRGIVWGGITIQPPPALEMIPNAHHLFELIQEVRGG